MLSLLQPPFLQKGQQIGLTAMASRVDHQILEPALNILKNEWKVKIIEGKSLRSSHYQFAGNDETRLNDLQEMIDNPDVNAIMSVSGGYGSYRLLERLDFKKFLENPKWIVGFSDITAVHCHVHNLGVQSIHAIMPKRFNEENVQESVNTLRQWLFGENVMSYSVPEHIMNRTGTATGQIIGGNLTLLAHVMSTPSDIKFDNKLLFIEDIDETLFSIDRMMVQLRRSGRLERISGLIVGQFTDLRITELPDFGSSVYEIILEHISDYKFPVCFNFPVGHTDKNLALPLGKVAKLSVLDNYKSELKFI